MGRPPSNGGPSFRFNQAEVGEMESILQAHQYLVPPREVLDALAQRFSTSAERYGKVEVSAKQVWNWFQNRRSALRAKAARGTVPAQVNAPALPQHEQSVLRNMPQAPLHQVLHPKDTQPQASAATSLRSIPTASSHAASVQSGSHAAENSVMEFEAKSARDGAWYDVAYFLSHRALESGNPEVLVRFSGFGAEEDEWVNVLRLVRQRSLPCESSECVAVLPGDLILCFQEGKEQALYFDAHVLDAQRRRHDKRGCRCRFLVRYDHDLSEEIVPLRKICRRPETDYRLQQLHAIPPNVNQQKPIIETQSRSVLEGVTTQQPKANQNVHNVPTTTALGGSSLPAASEPSAAAVSVNPSSESATHTVAAPLTASSGPSIIPPATAADTTTVESSISTSNPSAADSKGTQPQPDG